MFLSLEKNFIIELNELYPKLIISTKRPFTSGAAYKSIWNHEQNESPLLTITKAQTEKIKEKMFDRYGDKVLVNFCMRYGNPSTKSVVKD